MIHANYDSYNDDNTENYDTQPAASPSKLKLVLPPLSAVKLKISGEKNKKNKVTTTKGPPRPQKLKPLKEVLARLIAQIKKKDDYAFFLNPVDVSVVPGYSDAIKRPMDFGTVSQKVNKGKYRSLEEFKEDVQLVTANAKIFNPSGTIYHTEAERIENWALDHIQKAFATVIEYETDWKISVDDDDDVDLNVEDDDDADVDAGVPGSPDGPDRRSTRSPSILDSAWGRRPPQRAAVRKIMEKEFQSHHQQQQQRDKPLEKLPLPTLDEDGHMPGYQDGVGQFPPDSDWARMMVELKLRDKKYRTKKERLRIEKEGLPLCPDGSLNYFEIEDPFTKLEALVPDPWMPPMLTPLAQTVTLSDASQTPLPAPTSILIPHVPTLEPLRTSPQSPKPPVDGRRTRKHFVINRSMVSRAPAPKPAETTASPAPAQQDTQASRTPLAADYGPYATLMSRLASESHVSLTHITQALGTEERLFAFLRASTDAESLSQFSVEPSISKSSKSEHKAYFHSGRARDAASYIRDIVYGGIDGYAYARSIAQFVSSSQTSGDSSTYPLKTPLSQYVFETLLDPLTIGRLKLLRDVAQELACPDVKGNALSNTWKNQIQTSQLIYPERAKLLAALKRVLAGKIDPRVLIRSPEELLGTAAIGGKRKREEEDEGARKRAKDEAPTDAIPTQLAEHKETQSHPTLDLSSPTAVSAALRKTADGLLSWDRRLDANQVVKREDDNPVVEESSDRILRLQLLDIVKALPVDFIGINGTANNA